MEIAVVLLSLGLILNAFGERNNTQKIKEIAKTMNVCADALLKNSETALLSSKTALLHSKNIVSLGERIDKVTETR